MNWQEIISLLLVATAALSLIRSEFRKHNRRKIFPCAGDCQCGTSIRHLQNRNISHIARHK